jgi:hypothetical protein
MPHSSARAGSALLPDPAARPVVVEGLPDWESPPSFAAFSAARRRALASIAQPSVAPPDPPRDGDDGDEDTNPGDLWEEVAP